MRKTSVLAFLLALSLASGCANTSAARDNGSSGPKDLGIKYAKNFKIDYLDESVKIITDSDGRKLLLVPKGVKEPSGYEGAVKIETPITKGMFTSTTHIGFISSLGDDSTYDAVAAVTTPEASWSTPQIIERFKEGKVKYVEQSHWEAGDIEEIVKIMPDIVFSGGGDDSGIKLRGLLDAVGINYATILDWTEEGAEANLEWIKFFAAFYNLDEKADSVFNSKLSELRELEAKAAGVPAEGRPTVAYGMVYSGTVYTQSGTSTLARQVEKAGGTYMLSDLKGEGSISITMEEFLDKCRHADVLIYSSLPQYCPDKQYLLETEPLFAEFDAFKNDKIYILDKGYYMNSAKVVEKFADQLWMFQPSLVPNHTPVMYQKLPDKQ